MKTINKGFTLVELIIVIAVIGVLAAILIPVFSNVIEKANAKSALSDAKNALEIYIADSIDYTGGLPIGEGSVFKIKKANKDWYYTYYDNALHEGTGAENADALRPIPIPENSTKIMASDSVYISEQDATTEFYDNLPNTVVIYNTGAATYTPPAEDIEYDGEFILISKQSHLTNEFFAAHGMDKKYKLKNDIALTGNFTPIDGAFTGELNGNGKTVSGLNINEPNGINVALFRQVNGGKLYNFALTVNNIVGKGDVGTICGSTNGGRFTNVHVKINGVVSDVETDPDDTFTGKGCVGGFCAFGKDTAITRCSVTGAVRCKAQSCLLGGFLSHLQGTMTECFFSGKLVGKNSAGFAYQAYNATVENCYVKASYEGVVLAVGFFGISVNDTENKIKNCVSICTDFSVDPDDSSTRAAAFAVDYYNTCEVTNCYTLSDNPLTKYPYYIYDGNACENGKLINSFSQANCPGLNANGIVWSFAGEYPTLVNNPE